MAASLREGASSPFSDSLGREEARQIAKSHHARLHRAGAAFSLPDLSGDEKFAALLKEHSTVGLFAGRAAWFEPLELESWLLSLAAGHDLQFAYPRLSADAFEFRACEARLLVERPPFGLREPSESARIVTPSLVFVPCTLADLKGHRMGRGKGHFDRYLARHPGVFSVGVCHEEFLLGQFPANWTQPHDQDMSAILSNQRFVKIPNKGDPTV